MVPFCPQLLIEIASTAPAYRLAASLGYVVIVANGDGIVGVEAPLFMAARLLPGRLQDLRREGLRLHHIGDTSAAFDPKTGEHFGRTDDDEEED